MHKKWTIRKRLCTCSMAMTLLLHGLVVTPMAQANAAQNVQIQWSKWAIPDLIGAVNSGMFLMSPLVHEDFRQPISADNLQLLLQNIKKKFDNLALNKKKEQTESTLPSILTRKSVVNSVYDVLDEHYELPSTPKLDEEQRITYFQENGIIKGTEKGLELDRLCTFEEAIVILTRFMEHTCTVLGKGGKGLLWKVSHNGNTIYLFGSMGLSTTDFYPLHSKVTDAFDQSDELIIEEKNMSNEAEQRSIMQQQMMYSDGTTLEKHLSAETFAKVQKVFAESVSSAEHLNLMRPWLLQGIAESQLLGRELFSGLQAKVSQATDVASYFYHKAGSKNKPSSGLMEPKSQYEFLNSLPDDYHEKKLNEVLDSLLTQLSEKNKHKLEIIRKQLEQWIAGDISGFTASEQLEEEKETKIQSLVVEKHKNMANKLVQLLEKETSKTYFAILSASDFVSKNGLIDQLKEKGFTIQAVDY